MENNNTYLDIDGFNNHKDSDVRDYEASALIGDKRQGKSTLAKLLIQSYIEKYPDRKVLVYDMSNAFKPGGDFRGYPIITLDECYRGIIGRDKKRYRWKKGVRRLLPEKGIKHEQILEFMAHCFTDGLLVIDEATIVFGDNPSDEEKAVMHTHTNNRVDIYAIFHALNFVPKRLRASFWHYFMFKTGDGFGDWKEVQKLNFPNPQPLYEAWRKSQRAPHRNNQILQYFSIYTRDFQNTEGEILDEETPPKPLIIKTKTNSKK